jgi:hypothetical protein
MQRILIASLMALFFGLLFFGLFSMPASQAAPANGWAVGSAVKAISPINTIYYRRLVAIGAIAGDWTSVRIFVTGRWLQAGGPYSSGPPL